MKYLKKQKELDELLDTGRELSVRDFMDLYGEIPMTSVYARIRALLSAGRLSMIGKGRYVALPKPAYKVEITPWMQYCHQVMIQELEGVSHCLSERNGNMEIEVLKEDIEKTLSVLRKHFEKVMLRRDMKYLSEQPVGCILVSRIISEAPLLEEDGMFVPSAEKEIVDSLHRKEDVGTQLQQMMEVFPVNMNRLMRYAGRRGVKKELVEQLSKTDESRIRLFGKVQRYLAGTRVTKAWVFGSFARGEENEDSDLDLLVEYDKSAGLSLLGIIRYKLDLEKITGREIDLVENGYLKPFAVASAEQDKYLIYERKGQ